MNSETKPSLKAPPNSSRIAAEIAVADARSEYLAASPWANGPTSAASMAAEPEVAETARCREVPNSA
jgi:hypothetical protein